MNLSIYRFDLAALRLESRVVGSNVLEPLQRYIDICRTTVTGLLQWSQTTERYGISRYRDTGGHILIPL
jgi:hypothetical protein